MSVVSDYFLALVLMLGLFISPFSFSQEKQNTKQTQAISASVFEKLQEAQEMMENSNFEQANETIDILLGQTRLSSYERSHALNLKAYGYYMQQEYGLAINVYHQVLSLDGLSKGLRLSTLKTLSQLYFSVEKYEDALEMIDRFIANVEDAEPEIQMIRGQSLYQLGRYREAIAPLKNAIEEVQRQGVTPDENWLLLLRACYHEEEDFHAMLSILKVLVSEYPKVDYIKNIASVFSELAQTENALAMLEPLYESGLMSEENEVLNLGNLYLLVGLPYKAALTLEVGLSMGNLTENAKNLRLLSQAWSRAKEHTRSIAPMKKAAEITEDGELYLRLAQSYMNVENWNLATKSLRQAITKGGLGRTDTAHIMLGMALFNQKKLVAARDAFLNARDYKESAKSARQWLTYIDSEISRDKALKREAPSRAKRTENALLKGIHSDYR